MREGVRVLHLTIGQGIIRIIQPAATRAAVTRIAQPAATRAAVTRITQTAAANQSTGSRRITIRIITKQSLQKDRLLKNQQGQKRVRSMKNRQEAEQATGSKPGSVYPLRRITGRVDAAIGAENEAVRIIIAAYIGQITPQALRESLAAEGITQTVV